MSLTNEQEDILNHIIQHEPITQSKIIKEFQVRWHYKTLISARNAIGRILKILEEERLITKTQSESGKGIRKNTWEIYNG